MKASTIRLGTWLAAALVASVGVWQLVLFLKERDKRLFAADAGTISQQLRAPKKQDQTLRKAIDFYDPIRKVNVRGVEPPKPIDPSKLASSAPAIQLNPLETVVELKGTLLSAPDSKLSGAFVVWKDSQISEKDKKNRVLIFEGDAFPPPYDKKYKVARIDARAMIVVDENGKEMPALKLKELTLTMTSSRPGAGESRPGGDLAAESRPSDYAPPSETTKKSETEYWVSADDAKKIADEGLDLIGREVHTAPYLDPKTKRPTGLRITLIRPNSVASKFGLKEGDVVRELNGTPIKSTSDIYTFSQENPTVKNLALSFERYGRTVTLTYVLP